MSGIWLGVSYIEVAAPGPSSLVQEDEVKGLALALLAGEDDAEGDFAVLGHGDAVAHALEHACHEAAGEPVLLAGGDCKHFDATYASSSTTRIERPGSPGSCGCADAGVGAVSVDGGMVGAALVEASAAGAASGVGTSHIDPVARGVELLGDDDPDCGE